MPSLPAAANVLRIACSGVNGTFPWANIFHVKYTGGPPSAADLVTYAGTFATTYQTKFMTGVQITASALQRVQVVDLSSTTSPVGEWTGSLLGSVATASAPAQLAACISWRTNRRWRGGHPRTYIGALPISAMGSVTQWAGAFVTTMSTNAASFLTTVNGIAIGAASGKLGSVSYWDDQAPKASKPALRMTPYWDEFTSSYFHGRMDTQRRRLGRE